MWAVIDAHVFQQYYACTIRGAACALTCHPGTLFESKPEKVLLFLDAGEIIEQEWRDVVDGVWFDKWLSDALTNGKIRQIAAKADPSVRRDLLALGFPASKSRDIWYIRTANAALGLAGAPEYAFLVSEDMDFYAPAEKKAPNARRMKILLSSGGNVAKYLRKKQSIEVLCTRNAS
jgi:hypothetical protein